MKIRFEGTRSPEVGELVKKGGRMIVPIGACEAETSVTLYFTDLVDMSVADDTGIMKSALRNCPVDLASGRKKRFSLTTWCLENSTYGGGEF